jgi:transposase
MKSANAGPSTPSRSTQHSATLAECAAIDGADVGGADGVFAAVAPDQRRLLQRWARSRTTPHRVVVRSRVVLLALEGQSSRRVASRCGTSAATVRLWVTRVADQGVACLWHDASGRGRKPTIAPAVVAEIAALARRPDTPEGAAVNSLRAVARRFGVSPTTVRRIWQTAAAARVAAGGSGEAQEEGGARPRRRSRPVI